jgi:hypothetical protein
LFIDKGDGDVMVVKNVVSAFCPTARDEFAANDDAAFGEGHLTANLGSLVPTSLYQRRCNVVGANVAFAKVFFLHIGLSNDGRCYPRSKSLISPADDGTNGAAKDCLSWKF